ncbi:MAG: thiamine pyrophosphate-binding protein [Pseudomonadota bacterium]
MTLTNADVIARKLAACGCASAYGIPGGEVLTIIDALERAGISFHLTKHENFAGFMAEGSWHATGAPGILVATIGPGVANAVNVVANAFQDRVPLVFLTGCLDGADADTYTHQLFDHQAMLEGIVKGTFRADVESIDRVMDKAVALMRTGQPGPVHIDIPIKVAAGAAARAAVGPLPIVQTRFAPASDAIDVARGWLGQAERPLIVAGLDALNDGAGAALQNFAQTARAPFITSYKAKGLVDEGHPLCLGGAGLSPLADKELMPLLAGSDCIVLAGYDPIEMRVGWRDPWPDDAKVIDISPVVRTHGMHRAELTLYGDVGAVLSSLADGLTQRETWPQGEPTAARAALREAFAPEADGFGPSTVFHTMRDVLPADAVITADSGAHRILLSQAWTCALPRTMLQSSALCTMGCAIALAAGHKHAAPDVPVSAFVGDAGLEMTLGDLATVRDLKLAVPIVVLVDDSLALIEMKQRAAQMPNVGVDFAGTDFVTLAAAMGGHGVWIDDAVTLAAEAQAALDRPTFTLLCARIGRRAYDGRF